MLLIGQAHYAAKKYPLQFQLPPGRVNEKSHLYSKGENTEINVSPLTDVVFIHSSFIVYILCK